MMNAARPSQNKEAFMLSKQGFDLWANEYNQTVQETEEQNQYPFAGYKTILSTIFNEVMQRPHAKVLDIGFGTGVLTKRLYEEGHEIHGLDFSPNMIQIAKEEMPNAHLIEWDINQGVPIKQLSEQYEAIISTYTLHHLTDEEKVAFIHQLLPLLSDGGRVFIGDISFPTQRELVECREVSRSYWDDDEFYFVAEDFKGALKDICTCEFYPISHCGGVFILSK